MSDYKQEKSSQSLVEPGAYSLAEILSQTECWANCFADLQQSHAVREVVSQFHSAPQWLFIGCGSSYYVALAAAATMKSLTGRMARAIPASEVLLYPELVFSGPCVAVLISRSGQTSEVLKAGEVLNERKIPSIAVTCTKGKALEKLASITITLSADEQSTVMTRSFTSMLLALQFVAAEIAGNDAFREALIAMPALAADALKPVPAKVLEFVNGHTFKDYVCLGQGPYYGLACEYALKVMEMSVSTAEVFHSLEFRHGPKSIVTPQTLLVFLISEHGYQAECDLLEEMKALGGTTLVVANQANPRVRASADLLLELSLKLPELARLAPSLIPGQLLGLQTGLKKGLNPDTPRNLSRSVILNDDGSKRPEYAAF